MVRSIAFAWLLTLPAAAALAAIMLADLEGGLLMARRHWFLPDTPDVLGMLERAVAR